MNGIPRNIILASTLWLAAALAVLAEDYAINWYTIDGGGAGVSDASAGGSYTLSGTIGQPDARNHPEPMEGGSYKLTGGFWVIPECPAIQPDYDGDCDVDQADYTVFEACASGPDVPYAADCGYADLDSNGDVDQDDFAVFQQCMSGEGNWADPACPG